MGSTRRDRPGSARAGSCAELIHVAHLRSASIQARRFPFIDVLIWPGVSQSTAPGSILDVRDDLKESVLHSKVDFTHNSEAKGSAIQGG